MKPHAHVEEERLLTFARRYLSDAFPNPERVGCPDETALRSMAVLPRQADPVVGEHLPFCSPCFNRYMDLLAELRQEEQGQKHPFWREVLTWPKTSPMWIGSAVMVIGLVSMIAYFVAIQREGPNLPMPPQPAVGTAPIAASPFTLDLSELSPTRGPESRRASSRRPIHVPQSLLDLTLILPLGSEQQSYRMTLRSGDEVLWSRSAQAQLQNGQMLITTEADLRQVPPGSYNLETESAVGIRLIQPVLIGPGLPASKEQK